MSVRTGRAHEPVTIRPQPVQESNALPPCEHVPRRGTSEFTVFHGHGWEFCPDFGDQGGAWLPEVSEIRHTPGCNGVSEHGKPSAAIAGMMSERKRGIVIPNGDRRLPPEYRYYLAAYDVRGGGKYYCYPSVRFTHVSGGRAVIPVIDRQWEYGFRAALYAASIVPPMQRDVLQMQVSVLQNRAKRIRANAAKGIVTSESAREQIAEIEDTIAKWNAAYDRQFGEIEEEGPTVAPTLTTGSAPLPAPTVAVEPSTRPRKRKGDDDA